MTNGAQAGTGGWFRAPPDIRDLRTAVLFIVPATAVVVIVNALTALSDNPEAAVWEPWTWEISSAITIFVAMLIPWLATAAAPPDEVVAQDWRPRVRFVLLHAAALLLFSALHVAGFMLPVSQKRYKLCPYL